MLADDFKNRIKIFSSLWRVLVGIKQRYLPVKPETYGSNGSSLVKQKKQPMRADFYLARRQGIKIY